MIEKKKIVIVILTLYQILASLLGLYVFFVSVLKNSFIESIANIVLIFPIFLFSFISSVALLLYINNIKKVLIFTYINQGIQIFQIKFLGFGVYIVLGSFLNFGYLNNYGPEFFFDYSIFTANALLNINSAEGTMFTINIVPVIIIFLLGYLTKEKSLHSSDVDSGSNSQTIVKSN